MNKTLKLILIFIVAFTATIAINWWLDNRHYYDPGENDTFNLEVGDTFIIELHSNGSTGSENCFLTKTKTVRLLNEEFIPCLNARLGYMGAGGTTAYTFEGIKKGTDTIKVAFCPTASERKTCEDYNDKNTTLHNIFVVTVTED
jgi:predicted secreted protein